MRSDSAGRLMRRLLVLALVAGFVLVPTAASDPGDYVGPIFGIDTARDGSLLVADYGRGVVGEGGEPLIASLAQVQDVTRREDDDDDDDDDDEEDDGAHEIGPLWAVTAGVPSTQRNNQFAWRINDGKAKMVADLWEFEETHNPDKKPELNSNPFDVADRGGRRALVADAGANDLIQVSTHRHLNPMLVAVFPEQLVSTANVKKLLGCPNPAPPCGLPDMIPAESVPTSIAIGPRGDYFVGELTGFPAPTEASRVWRVRRNSSNVDCATSQRCSVVELDKKFTSIIDLTFGPDGRLYVAQIDDASWFAVELNLPGRLGGSVHACKLRSGDCERIVSGQPILTSITFREDGSLWGAINALVPGAADVVQLAPAP
jgi:hypothetical protein